MHIYTRLLFLWVPPLALAMDKNTLSTTTEHNHVYARYYYEDLPTRWSLFPLPETRWDPTLSKALDPKERALSHTPLEESLRASKAIATLRPYLRRRLARSGPRLEEDPPTYIRWVNDIVQWGLFATARIPPHTPIGIYTGIVTNRTIDTDYAWRYNAWAPLHDRYGVPILLHVDGLFAGNEMRFVNHGDSGKDGQANVRHVYVPYRGQWEIVYESTQEIAPNEQLLVDYGSGYWTTRES